MNIEKIFGKAIYMGKVTEGLGLKKWVDFREKRCNLDVTEVWQMECVLKNKTKKIAWDE